ncbi:uncharacterized protein PV09_00804 [Verruconis gallopava]|uniref:CFEM domain-containing protein n=1 Tax=Verruconis gallopava TaxID=253628 RepID=A0A0D2AQR9_9PEZI|nr:uncharacterized protein PV09_00804 [Verruconis gallopava]KIW08880.1 hypothetical protein PV09_00804 [Verruconis gallopava]
MQYAVVAAVLAATASAATVGDGVPLIYSPTPYPNPPYLGVQYNATVINGVPFNNSNEWPCLTAEKYFSIPPQCARQCLIETFGNATLCADDDFTCHCTAAGSAELDKTIIPCLSAANGPCTGEEIGELANFVHGALCPYFMATTYEEAYGHCGSYGGGSYGGGSYGTPSSSKGSWPATTSSSSAAGYWPKTTSSSSSKTPCSTSVQTSWTKECSGPTTFWVGEKTWTVTKATTLTVTDCPITWTKPISSGTWAPVEWTTPAPVASPTWVYSATTSPAAGWAKGTAAYSASPAQFTGAASNNKVAGAVAAVAAGAALMI